MLAEATAFHTRILRLTLAVPESRSYWERVEPSEPVAARVERAFTERWFSAKSMPRVRLLLANFSARFDAYPDLLQVLRRWKMEDARTSSLVCHWHLQLSDPLYRELTGRMLPDRAASGLRTVDRDVVARWVHEWIGSRWGPATRFQFANKLCRAAAEAGLLSSVRGGRRDLLSPPIPDEALGYLVRALRSVRFQGSYRDNPYVRSVGLDHQTAEHRLRKLPGVVFRRLGDVEELEADLFGDRA